MNTNNRYTYAILYPAIIIYIPFILNINTPQMGGDELWFATPLLHFDISQLSPFQFNVYSGPIKTIVGSLIFNKFGFNVVVVRSLTIIIFISTLILTFHFIKKNFGIKGALICISLCLVNYDLIHFSKVDTNQGSFNNFFLVILLIFTFKALEKWQYKTTFLIFFVSLIYINLHLRNIWVLNSIGLISFIFFIKDRTRNHLALILNSFVFACYFAFVYIYFKDHPGMIAGEKIGNGYNIQNRLIEYSRAITGQLTAVRAGYRDENNIFTITISALMLTTYMYAIYCKKITVKLKQLIILFFSISIQYIVTPSAIHPWHPNVIYIINIMILSVLITSITYKKHLQIIFLTIAFSIFSYTTLTNEINHSLDKQRGFDLAVYNLQSLDDIDKYLNRPENVNTDFIIDDWGIGRTLALKSKYNNSKRKVLQTDPSNDINNFIQSTPLTKTTGSLSIKKKGYQCTVKHRFYDRFGRETYYHIECLKI